MENYKPLPKTKKYFSPRTGAHFDVAELCRRLEVTRVIRDSKFIKKLGGEKKRHQAYQKHLD